MWGYFYEKVSKTVSTLNTNAVNTDYKSPTPKLPIPAEQKGSSKKDKKGIAKPEKKVHDYHETKVVVKTKSILDPIIERYNSLMKVDMSVSWCFAQANYTPPPLSCRVAMWQFWKQDKPIYGSAAVIDWDENENAKANGIGGAVGGAGHITFVVGISSDGKYYYCVGGNQGGVSGARTVKVSKYAKDVIDWFVIPPAYVPANSEYNLKIINSEAEVDTANTTRT